MGTGIPSLSRFGCRHCRDGQGGIGRRRAALDLARQADVSRQLVYAAVQRVRKILEEHQAQELVPVMVWLPPELAEQVRQMAAPYDQPEGKGKKGNK